MKHVRPSVRLGASCSLSSRRPQPRGGSVGSTWSSGTWSSGATSGCTGSSADLAPAGPPSHAGGLGLKSGERLSGQVGEANVSRQDRQNAKCVAQVSAAAPTTPPLSLSAKSAGASSSPS
eukprot:8622469-Pyramimonas_sp.AAC.1